MNPKAQRGSLASAMNWMAGLSLLLFWLPVMGPFIAGLVGGSKAGSIKRSALAALLPAPLNGLLAAIGVAFITHVLGWGGVLGGVWSAIAGLGAVVWSLAGIGPLLLGAVTGGVLATFFPPREP